MSIKVEVKPNWIYIRIKDPRKFRPGSFRWHDIGRPGHVVRLAGQLKKSGHWDTQALRIDRKIAYVKGMNTIVITDKKSSDAVHSFLQRKRGHKLRVVHISHITQGNVNIGGLYPVAIKYIG